MTRLIRPYDFILDAKVGWQLAKAVDTSAEKGSIQLKPGQDLLPSLTEPNGSFGGFTLPRGVAIWQEEIFIADASRHCIWHWRPCCGSVALLPTIGGQGSEPRQLDTPLGLAISHRDDLVVADAENRRLLLFTLPGLALRRIIGPLRQRDLLLETLVFLYRLQPIPLVLWLVAIVEVAIWHPIDVAAGSDGTLYVADNHNNLVWRLDAQGRPDPYYSGKLPTGDVPRRLLVDGQHRVYVIVEKEKLLILNRYGCLIPSVEKLESIVLSWLRLHFYLPLKFETILKLLILCFRLRPIPLILEPAVFFYQVQVLEYACKFDYAAQARAAILPVELSQMIDIELNRFISEKQTEILEKQTENQRVYSEINKDDVWLEYRDEVYRNILPKGYNQKLPQFLQQILPPSRLKLLPQAFQQKIEARLKNRGLEATVENQRTVYGELFSQFQQDLELTSATSPKSDRLLLLGQTCPFQPQFTDLTIDAAGRLQLPDGSAGPYLIHRPPIATFVDGGLFQIQSLDSKRIGNPWHRVVLDLTAPERTSLRLFSFTSDIRRPDLTTDNLLEDPPQLGMWKAAPPNVDEWLIQSSPGRYLYLALVLRGSGDRTPSVERIYVYKERQSSLQYLPALYQADETSRDVLDRFLSLFDTIFGEVESTIEDFPLYLDLQGTPPDFLPWLASWFDLKLLPSWDEAKRRQFLQEIVKLYRWRGTIQGLRKLLQLHTDLQEPMPQIVEHFRGKNIKKDESQKQVVSKGIETWLGEIDDASHHFTVLMPAYTINTPDKRLVVERLIDANKPAHTHYNLRAIYPGIRLSSSGSRGNAMGLDSLLSSRIFWQLANTEESDRFLGEHSVLPDVPMAKAVTGKLGYSRLGISKLGSRNCPPCENQSGDSEL